MRLRRQDEDQVDIRLSFGEFVLLQRMLREVCTSMHFSDNDFRTIFDIDRAEAEQLLVRMQLVADRLHLLVPERD